MERISIIGSGFCGTALAIQLLRQATRPLHLRLFNRSGQLARGLAYGTRSASHILNVPAERMSLFDEQSSDFLTFARQHLPNAQPGDFLPRSLYGDYLQQRLQEAIEAKQALVHFDCLASHVIDLQQTAEGMQLCLDDGQTIICDRVVIATGNFSPATPPPLRGIADDPRYIADPWREDALLHVADDARVLLLGSGLTMYDMALALQDKGHRGPLQAISRRALQPHGHRDNAQHPKLPQLPDTLLTGADKLSTLVMQVRTFVADAQADGFDWRDAIAALRPITPALWQNLDDQQRRRFLRHLQPYWEVHRHRAAPPIAQRIDSLRQDGQLRVQACRLLTASATDEALLLSVQPRGTCATTTLSVDHIINCTGPCNDLQHLGEPMFNALHSRGAIRQDANRIGLEVDTHYRLLDDSGNAQPNLYLLSPMLRAHYWESSAVPELRQHAQQLATILLG
ncbi:MAG: FAD/NAD(P)-binding protein [Pseudomonas sp.]